jgi:manganese transport system ATP-binding protein
VTAATPATASAAASTAPALEVTGLRVAYDDVLALDGVDLALAPGRVHGLVGPNGSGKSSLFKAVVGVLRPTAGTVRVAGEDPASTRARGAVAYVPQAEGIDGDFPVRVRDVVMMGRYGRMGPLRRARRADVEAVDAALGFVKLTDLADRQIGRLSGGQRKRALLARAIAQEASLLLLDEPFTGVDRPSEDTITRLLRELAAGGRTALVATHDLVGLPELADEVVLLNRCVVAHTDPASALEPDLLVRTFGAPPRRGAEPGGRPR